MSRLRIGDVAGVADGGFTDLAVLPDRLHGNLHAGGPVERIKNAEDVDSRIGSLFDELLHDVVRIIGIADGVRTAQQHLEENVRDQLGKLVQPLPGVFLEEAHGDVKGCSAPALQGEELGAKIGSRLGDFEQVMGTDAGGKIGLMGITHGGVGDKKLLLLQYPLGQPFGSQLHEEVFAAGRPRLRIVDLRHSCLDKFGRFQRLGNAWRTVDNDIPEKREHLAGSVLLLPESGAVPDAYR